MTRPDEHSIMPRLSRYVRTRPNPRSPAKAGAHDPVRQVIWTPAFAGEQPRPREPGGGWLDLEEVEPQPVQICLSVGRLVHDDDNVKIIAGSAMIVGEEQRVLLSGVIEIPARCVVSIVRLEERARL
jgi:hypothetical protein